MSDRIGDWMSTYTGKKFYPLDPRPEDICIEDICHALAHTCRFGGHCLRFYSVAQHSVIVSQLVLDSALAFEALMHDAPEAYLCDIPRPLKMMMPQMLELEQKVWLAVATKFGLPKTMSHAVEIADNVALITEKRDLLCEQPEPWYLERMGFTPDSQVIRPLNPREAEHAFMKRFKQLCP